MGSVVFGIGIAVGVVVGILLCGKDYDEKKKLESIVFTDDFLSYCCSGGIKTPNVNEYNKYLKLKQQIRWEISHQNLKKLEERA